MGLTGFALTMVACDLIFLSERLSQHPPATAVVGGGGSGSWPRLVSSRLCKVPHPVPARRAEGATQHRLVPDPVRGTVVTEIFRMRALERLGYQKIADRLNQDLGTYPPPIANQAEATIGLWTVQSVRGILENPKYTGYQV